MTPNSCFTLTLMCMGACPRGRPDLHRGAMPVSAAWVRNKGQ